MKVWMSNPFLDRAKQHSTEPGRKSEKRVAKKLGARLHPASGAMKGYKSDATLTEADFRLEMKSTTRTTLPLEMGWLAKITVEALEHSQKPGLVFSFVDAEGKPVMKLHSEWIAIPLEIFKELISHE